MMTQSAEERREELEQMAFNMAASLETKVRQWVEIGEVTIEKGEASELLTEVTEMLQNLMLQAALKQTEVPKFAHGQEYVEWNRQKTALLLGIPHKRVNSMIKKFDLIVPQKPEKPDPQQTIPFPPGGQSGRKDIYD